MTSLQIFESQIDKIQSYLDWRIKSRDRFITVYSKAFDEVWVHFDGEVQYFHYGKLHRLDGPALIESSGNMFWYQYGRLHRADGPAIISTDGYQAWYQMGLRHRINGPAEIFPNGNCRDWIWGQTG